MERIFSGIKPSGDLTLGNYLGAIRNFVKLQHEADSLFCVVDLHALTVPQNPELVTKRSLDIARLFVASGIDPDVSTLFVQSHVPAHSELGWLLGCSTYFGELRRMTQFKDLAAENANVSAGLFTYPVLMAADILLYETDRVPVGDDQKQHLELARNIAERVNNRFGELFKVPEPYIPPRSQGGRIMRLDDPTVKMGKSNEDPKGSIEILDTPNEISRKIRSAVTDSGREVRYDEIEKPAVSNLMVIFSLCSGESMEAIEERYGSRGYGDFKRDLADRVIDTLRPIQERFRELEETGSIEAILEQGRAQAHEIAVRTLTRYQEVVGLVPRAEFAPRS